MYQLHSRAGPKPRSTWLTKNRLHGLIVVVVCAHIRFFLVLLTSLFKFMYLCLFFLHLFVCCVAGQGGENS